MAQPEIQNRRIADIMLEVQTLQDVQKTHRPSSAAWGKASELLSPLFDEIARRTKDADIVHYWTVEQAAKLPKLLGRIAAASLRAGGGFAYIDSKTKEKILIIRADLPRGC